MIFAVLLGLVLTAVMIWAYCRICSKAGYCWALGLLMLVPVANLILLLFLAFAEWPIERQIVPQPTNQ